MKILKFLHTLYGVIVFWILFILSFPFLLIPILFPQHHSVVGAVNRWWARLLFFFIAIPFKTTYKMRLDRKKQYIFCPNHFSYLDIPAIGLNRHNTIFVGKNDIAKVPLFGYMFKKLHITVDRTKLKSRYSTMVKSMEALDDGKNLVIFPEGGIVTEGDPVMGPFKDGAFRASIQKQIPIVPVTIPYNWIILPPNEFLLTWRPLQVIFHEPIDPAKYKLNEIDLYKQHVRQVIEEELKKHLHENRPAVTG